MAQIKHQFYHKGHEADITIDLKRPERDKMKEWTVEEKIAAKAFMSRMESQFEIFKNEILEGIK